MLIFVNHIGVLTTDFGLHISYQYFCSLLSPSQMVHVFLHAPVCCPELIYYSSCNLASSEESGRIISCFFQSILLVAIYISTAK